MGGRPGKETSGRATRGAEAHVLNPLSVQTCCEGSGELKKQVRRRQPDETLGEEVKT